MIEFTDEELQYWSIENLKCCLVEKGISAHKTTFWFFEIEPEIS